ncbi:unnamed protein product [Periconia digitata]|uniref:Rhodopsin domain-containing protein n=1 Tax=Periconia digitata TaxID=1303443 RepID=A0A9W4UPF8_9PLEO|nr:unnamed protein product [Periconia digitata]
MAADDRASEYTGVLGFFIAITTISVSLRCYTKLFIVKSFSSDDIFAVLTLFGFLVFCTLALLGVSKGTGKQRYLIPDNDFPDGMKWWWGCEPTYIACSICLKTSIGIFLLRIAVDRVHRMILWTCLIVIQVYSVFFFFLFTFQCTPVSNFWTRFRGVEGKCIDSNIIVGTFYGYSALVCITDWTFSIVPIFIVRRLQMSSQKKVSVAVVLAFCAIGSTATVIRIPYIEGLKDAENFLYTTTDVAIWSISEVGIGLFAASTATLRPLLRVVLGDSSITGGSSSRKMSRNWGGTNPLRSGYMGDASDNNGGHVVGNGIPLDAQDPKKYPRVNTTNNSGLSRSTSTSQLRDWESKSKDSDDDSSPVNPFRHGGITKTVNISQVPAGHSIDYTSFLSLCTLSCTNSSSLEEHTRLIAPPPQRGIIYASESRISKGSNFSTMSHVINRGSLSLTVPPPIPSILAHVLSRTLQTCNKTSSGVPRRLPFLCNVFRRPPPTAQTPPRKTVRPKECQQIAYQPSIQSGNVWQDYRTLIWVPSGTAYALKQASPLPFSKRQNSRPTCC